MDGPLNLAQTAAWVDAHASIEEELFRVTGFWSANPQGGGDVDGDPEAGAVDAAAQAFFAAESAHHGWRAEQWEIRRVRSVDPDPAAARWVGAAKVLEAIAAALGDDLGPASRLAVWGHLWAPTLAAHYARHLKVLSPAADAGLSRWLGICVADLQRGSTGAVELLVGGTPASRRGVPEALSVSSARLSV